MCFNEEASLILGSFLVVLGAFATALVAKANLTAKSRLSLAPFALIPLFFGIQQISEGFLWRSNLQSDAARDCFTFFAFSFWPGWVPFSLFVMELTRPIIITESSDSNEKQVVNEGVDDVDVQANAKSVAVVASPAQVDAETSEELELAKAKIRVRIMALALAMGVIAFFHGIRIVMRGLKAEQRGWSIVYDFDSPDHVIFDEIHYSDIGFYVIAVVVPFLVSSVKYTSRFACSLGLALVVAGAIYLAAYASIWCFMCACLSTLIIGIIKEEIATREAYWAREEARDDVADRRQKMQPAKLDCIV